MAFCLACTLSTWPCIYKWSLPLWLYFMGEHWYHQWLTLDNYDYLWVMRAFLYLEGKRVEIKADSLYSFSWKHSTSRRSDFYLHNFHHKACGTCHFLRSGKYTLSLTPPPKLMIVKLVSVQSGAPLLRPTVSICMKLLVLIHAMNRG